MPVDTVADPAQILPPPEEDSDAPERNTFVFVYNFEDPQEMEGLEVV